MSNKRPFFSCVIPCYNDGRYKEGIYLDRLLSNLYLQNIPKEELEIILSDDHSPVSFDFIVDKWSAKLNLKHVVTEYNFAPGNTRQYGTKFVTGEWLFFVDHDDLLYPNALVTVKKAIEDNHESRIVYCDFNKVNSNNLSEVVEEFRWGNLLSWVHGKLYNLDNFWKKHDLHFPKDLRTHEDIALGNQVHCVLLHEKDKPILYVNSPVYLWTENIESISNTRYNTEMTEVGSEHTFLERAFGDYLESEWGMGIEMFSKGYLTLDDLVSFSVPLLFNCWLIIHSHKLANPTSYIKENEMIFSKYLHRFLDVSNLSVVFLKVLLLSQYARELDKLDSEAKKNSVPKLLEWLESVS